jgi:tetratricopeptide (TPR) repeat protein
LNKRILFVLVATTLLVEACAVTKTPPPAVAPLGEMRFLVDPRIGFQHPADPVLNRKFDAAWRFALADDFGEARRLLTEIRTKNPDDLPAALAEAAIDIRQGQLDTAQTIVQRLEDQAPDYTAARVYDAEIAIAQNKTRRAYEIYRALSQRPDAPPTVAERLSVLQSRLFEELFTAARGATDEAAIPILREALTINPAAPNARIALANKLIARKSYDEAIQVLDPLISSPEFDKDEVQESLAEIEAGRGQYEQAIARYERLARSNRDPRYARRLEQIKEDWNAANMPPQYQRAIETDAIDRADLAVLMYWKVSSVRFAQNLGEPPIAIDIEGVPGRDEIIRAIAIGLYDVDPVTRRVSPPRPINTSTLARLAAKLLLLRGASCAKSLPYERDELLRAQRILAACGVTDPSATAAPDAPASGQTAAALLDEIEKVLTK